MNNKKENKEKHANIIKDVKKPEGSHSLVVCLDGLPCLPAVCPAPRLWWQAGSSYALCYLIRECGGDSYRED